MKRHLSKYIFCYLFCLMFAFFIYSGYKLFIVNSENEVTTMQSFDEGWTDKIKNVIDLSDLNSVRNTTLGEAYEIYHKIPDAIKSDQTVYFKSSNIAVTVLIDNKKVYESGYDIDTITGSSAGDSWNHFTISAENAGDTLTFRITNYYTSFVAISSIYYGEGTDIQQYLFSKNILTLVIPIIIAVIGIVLLMLDRPFSRFRNKKHDLLYLGIYAVTIAIWLTLNSDFLLFLIENTAVLHFVRQIAILLLSLPMLLFLYEHFELNTKKLINLGCIISVVGFVACIVLHFMQIWELHYSAKYIAGIETLYVGLMLIISVVHAMKSDMQTFQKIETLISTILLISGVIADLVMYMSANTANPLTFTSAAILIFVLGNGILVLRDIAQLVNRGIEAEEVEQIAYSDALTNVGNRAAFNETLQQIEKDKDLYAAIGLVMLDINDLKKINDIQGHKLGDQLIITGARVIKISFGKIGTCFRIGGDEFAVIISGDHVEQDYQRILEEFEGLIRTHNNRIDAQFTLKIAYGVSFYHKNDGIPLAKVLETADANMYAKKKQMKGQAPDGIPEVKTVYK